MPLAWVNQALFDYKGVLRSGTETLPCWTINPEEPLEDLPNPIGMNFVVQELQHTHTNTIHTIFTH